MKCRLHESMHGPRFLRARSGDDPHPLEISPRYVSPFGNRRVSV